jgi:two-component system sensor kinase FixL
LRTLSIRRYVEAALLGLGLVAVSVAVFVDPRLVTAPTPTLPYALTPFLIWAAVRLGPFGTSTALLVVVFVAIWGAIHGYGPFIATSPLDSALGVQLFLIVVSIPILFLAALTEETRQTAKSLRDEIAERGRAEAALRASEARFASAFRSSPAAMVITRQSDGQIIDVNGRWQTLFGFARAEAIGHTASQLGIFIDTQDAMKLGEHIRGQSRIRDLEMSLRTRSGTLLQAIVTSDDIVMSAVPCYISIVRDVTEQRSVEREAQEQRRQMTHLTRVASLGQLSGALAHELNQPLTAILSNAQAAQRYLAHESIDLDGLREILGDIVSDDKRAAEVIRRLRALLKRGETQFLPIDINEVVQETLALAHSDIVLRRIAVKTDFAPRLPVVRGDRVQLQQVLLNLIANASDAMNSNDSAERELNVTTTLDGAGDVQVSVRDRGHGIADDQRDRLFEPFYTTKTDGLGIGLSISRSIITSHAGKLWAENDLGGGAIFHFSIPAGGKSS